MWCAVMALIAWIVVTGLLHGHIAAGVRVSAGGVSR